MQFSLTRRSTLMLLTAGALALSVGTAPAYADDFPSKPITIVVPFAPGGGASQGAQVIADGLQKVLGQTVIIDNQPGAATVIGTAAVARAAPDGYTLLLASTATAVNEGMVANKPYDALTDLTPIALTVDAPYALLANKDIGIDSVADLVAKAKAAPNSLAFGSGGIGSSHQLFMLYLMKLTGMEMRHIPYAGGNPAATAVASGEVAVTFADAGAAQEMIKGGLVKALAVSPGKRLAILPDVPTMEEAGINGFDLTTWQGIMGPKDMDPAIVNKLSVAINEVLSDPDLQASLQKSGKSAMSSTPESFAGYFSDEVARWKQLIEDAGIRPR